MNQKTVPVIRQADSRDASLLADLAKRTFVESFGEHNDPNDMAQYVADSFSTTALAAQLADPLTTILIAEIAEIACGYARLAASDAPPSVTGPDPIELVRLYVSREWLGSGVGPALMEASLETARRLGYRTIWLGVWESNERALAFYRKWKFQTVGTKTFHLGSDNQTDFVMELALI